MDFETIQQVWTTEQGGELTMPEETLIREVIAKDRQLARKVRRRDLVELATALGMAAVFLWVSFAAPIAWPWWLAAAITAGVGAVFVRERRRTTGSGTAGHGVRAALDSALAEAEHQIHLLRSVAWWYLLPLAVVVLLVLGGTAIGVRAEVSPEVWARGRVAMITALGIALACVAAGFGFVWWLNQHAVRTHLEPHRERLVALIQQLDANGVTEGR